MELQDLNVVVIGAGVGGLAAGALLARKGAMVTVLEAQDYPGGCAATFAREGYRFDAGATIGCGFHNGGPMDILGKELGIQWPVSQEAVAWQYRHNSIHLDLPPQRLGILERFPRSAPFWKEQADLAKLLWHLAEGGLSWPAKGARDLARLARKGIAGLPGSAHLLSFSKKTVHEWLASHGLDSDPDFVRFIDAQLLVSVQTTSKYANAINAAIALDLPLSGSYRVKGGIGTVSELLAAAIEENGGAALSAGRIMLKRMDSLIETCTSFAFETTCAGRGHYELIQRCQKIGYRVTLLFFWLPSVDLALARVARRVSQGGHDIPSEVIKRRYHAGLTNLVRLYWPIVQDGAIFDAEYTPARDIIEKSQGSGETVHNPVLWQTIQKGR